MAKMPEGTVIFLFADIEEGIGNLETNANEKNAALEQYDALFRHAMEANGGYTYKKVGSSFQVAFPTAAQAAAAAAEAERTLHGASRAARHGVAFKGVRIAIHAGVADMRDGGYAGPLLNRVARVLAAAHGGQVLLTQAAEELLGDDLPTGTALRDLGEHRLKDLIRLERIFQLDYEDPASLFPPLGTLDNRPHNLPTQPTPLVGREAEVDTVRAELLRDDVSLLTLLGAGGIGKTRLALQVAAELIDDFSDGVFFVNLAPITDAALVTSSIGQVLGLVESGEQPLLNRIRAYLRDTQLLLVLDNCEQVPEVAPYVADLINSAPRLKVLATSRAALHLTIEHEYPVPPLSVPGRGAALPVESLLQYEAVGLFVARARSIKADFGVNDGNKEAVAEICRRLDGLPLAIELAAARTKVLAPEAILARLAPDQWAERGGQRAGGAGRLLTGGTRDMPTRQQTLRNTIQWSYDLLSAGEQRLFNRLGIFVGGHTLEAAEAVCNSRFFILSSESSRREEAIKNSKSRIQDSVDVLDGIGSLVDKSLLYSREMRGSPRFLMLETLREYALEQLHESGEEDPARHAHASYYLELAELAEPYFTGASQGEWFDRLEADHDNVRAAVDWLHQQAAAEDVGRLAGALWRFWFRRGYMSEGRRILMLALERGDALSDAVHAKVLHGAGVLAYEQGDYEQAKGYYEKSLDIRRKLGDKKGMIASLNNLANVSLFGSDYERAAQLYEQALELARELQDNWSIAITLGNKGWVEMNKGDYDRAAALYEESLALRRLMGDEWGMANALDNLAWARTYQSKFAEAALVAADSMAIFEKLGDKDSISDLLDIQGRCALGEGSYALAQTLFLKSLSLNRELEDKSGTALCLLGLAALAGARSEWARAARLFGAADALRASTADFQRLYFHPHEALVREQLGAPGFDRLKEEGRAMSVQQAIVYASEQPTEGAGGTLYLPLAWLLLAGGVLMPFVWQVIRV